LKISKSFVDDAADAGEAGALVASVIDLAHTLQIASWAVGVEREDQLEALQMMGCTTAQGFFLGPPFPSGWLIEMLGERS
jgi:EAL domain-containing protein (putative c-di-GMP-specific phosphodiesterase class I)